MIDTVSWPDFLQWFQWRQGEHIAAVAPTGAGKTTLLAELIPLRRYSIFFGTKLDDPLYRQIIRRGGFTRLEDVSEIRGYHDKILLWPRAARKIPETYQRQKEVFTAALDKVANDGGWTVWLDECKYLAEQLGLTKRLTYCLEQLRSVNGTIISGAQRPVWLPRSVLSNSTHVFLWRSNSREDARRLADIGGIDAGLVMQEAKTLAPHEFIYINGRNGNMVKSQVKKGR